MCSFFLGVFSVVVYSTSFLKLQTWCSPLCIPVPATIGEGRPGDILYEIREAASTSTRNHSGTTPSVNTDPRTIATPSRNTSISPRPPHLRSGVNYTWGPLTDLAQLSMDPTRTPGSILFFEGSTVNQIILRNFAQNIDESISTALMTLPHHQVRAHIQYILGSRPFWQRFFTTNLRQWPNYQPQNPLSRFRSFAL